MRKRSTVVSLTLVTAAAAALLDGCGHGVDPCEARTCNEIACQQAIAQRGYHYQGHWYPHIYSGGYSGYFTNYNSYRSHGGTVTSAPFSSYTPSRSVSRGGFGAIGSGHGSAGGGGS